MDAAPQENRVCCPSCGKDNAPDASFCNNCGHRLADNNIAFAKPKDPLIDRVVEGRFRVIELIGEGGMGRVYRAEQTTIGRQVALKVLSPEYGRDEKLKERFRNEAALASRLNHPNTVTIFDFGVTADGLMFIAMELITGKSLREELDLLVAIPWQRAANILKQVCGSLQDAHDNAIIHRDLKPENIMLMDRHSECDIVKVLDFGVAKILVRDEDDTRRSLTAPNEIFGTPEYMSPEQARGDELTQSSDLYAMGVMMYRMLSGALPFDARTPIAILAKHLGEEPPPLHASEGCPQLPEELISLVMAALAKKADQRPQKMDEIRLLLDVLIQEALHSKGSFQGENGLIGGSVGSAHTGTQKDVEAPTIGVAYQSDPSSGNVEKTAQVAEQKQHQHEGDVDARTLLTEPQQGQEYVEPRETTVDSIEPGMLQENQRGIQPGAEAQPQAVQSGTEAQPQAVQGVQPQPQAVQVVQSGAEGRPQAGIQTGTEDQEPGSMESADLPEDERSPREKTLQRLLSRIRKKRDFPAVSQHISELNTKVGLDRTSASQLANVILKDTSLTSRLIKLSNSPFYGNSRGKITMVSRAVVLMGFDAVREAALGLLLFDHMVSDNPKHASELRDAAIASLMSGIIAKQNAWRIDGMNKEEAFICAMFHNLGRHAAIFYFPEEMEKVSEMVEKGMLEENAVRMVFGITFDDLGEELAKQWDFPERIRKTIEKLPASALSKPKSQTDKLRHLAGFATELTRISSTTDRSKRSWAFVELVRRFQGSFKISKEELGEIVDETVAKLEDYAQTMNLRPGESNLVRNIMKGAGKTPSQTVETPGEQRPNTTRSGRIIRDPNMSDADYQAVVQQIEAEQLQSKEQILLEGVQEVASSIKGRFDLNSLMLTVLETMYRGLGLRRVIFCLYDVRTKRLRARFGFGDGVDKLVPDFHFPARAGRDVFGQALGRGTDIIVTNASDKRYFGQIPDWYKTLIDAPMFLLYPVRIKSFPTALFYGEMGKPDVSIEPVLLEQVKGLRDEAAKAIAATNKAGGRR